MSPAKNNIIKHAKLDWSDQSEPYSTFFGDVYFNSNQGLKESLYVFFDGNNLLKQWEEYQGELFCIAETGFGSGLNFMSTANAFLNVKQKTKHASLKRLHYISFEQFPLTIEDIKKTLSPFSHFNALLTQLAQQYPLPLIGCHRLSFNGGNIILDLWLGDVNEQIDNLTHQENGIVDTWYLDGFNPSNNPTMWHSALFQKMVTHSKPTATLATFTAAGFVRRALIAVGFNIEKRKGYGKKREMLIGTLNLPTSVQPSINADITQKKQLPNPSIEPKVSLNPNTVPKKSSDIAIIGGGIASLCNALSLAKRGQNVTLYCADKVLGSGASGNQQGALYPLLNAQHDALGQFFSNAYSFALNFYHDINLSYPFSHQFNGLIQLAYDQSSTDKLQKITKANLPTQLLHWIDAKETNKRAGISIDLEALYYPQGGWLSPLELIQALTKALAQYENVHIHCNHKIESITYEEDNWILKKETPISLPDQVEFKHETIVIAAGFDTLKFNQCRAVPLSAARGQVSHINATPSSNLLKRTLCHEGYITPSLYQQQCMGATFKRHDDDIEYRESEQQENFQKLKKCIPNQAWVESIKVDDQAHIGIRCTTRDHFPYIGALTDYDYLKNEYQSDVHSQQNFKLLPNAYLLTGLGSRGLCTAPLLGEILASVIHNESLPIDKHIYEKMQIPRQWKSYMRKNKPLKD